jgi:adenosine deaminase
MVMTELRELIRRLPKAELHLHVEGSLEPEMMFDLARKNGVALPYASVEALRTAYDFTDLQSFLDLYYAGAAVLRTARDFHELTAAYVRRARADEVRHAEIFFDPQTHTARGVPLADVFAGIAGALRRARAEHGFSSRMILCFLRHLSEADALATLDAALPLRAEYADLWIGVGLDSSEVGHPPEKFANVFARARALGFRITIHAGEEGPPEYVRSALDVLGAERIDHGVRCERDGALMARLARTRTPLTMCPLSNLKLRVVEELRRHNLARLLRAGLCITVNSDDPAYFGGYIGANFTAAAEALSLSREEIVTLARNGFLAAFVTEAERRPWLDEIEAVFLEGALPPQTHSPSRGMIPLHPRF